MNFLTSAIPDAPHPFQRDTDGGHTLGGSNEIKTWSRYHDGMTQSERVSCGRGSAEDNAAVAENNRLHKVWLASPAGQKFYETLKSVRL